MQKSITISSSIRPIKKLCILEKNDKKTLIKIINNYSSEIGGIFNLILLNDESLFSKNTLDFVNAQDPDIIVNYSFITAEKIFSQFKRKVIEKTSGKGAIDYGSISAPYWAIDHLPDHRRNQFALYPRSIFCSFSDVPKEEKLHLYLNFGVFPDWPKKGLQPPGLLLKSYSYNDIKTDDDFKSHLKNIGDSALSISESFCDRIYLFDVDEINDNKEPNFFNKPAVIIGDFDKLESMVYFWNVRATSYPVGIIWLPSELKDLLRDFPYSDIDCANFSSLSSEDIERLYRDGKGNIRMIPPDKYYFLKAREEWKDYEHLHNVILSNDTFTIVHPNEKFLSINTWDSSNILELKGVGIFNFPDSYKIADLFIDDKYLVWNKYGFARISDRKLILKLSNGFPINQRAFPLRISIPPQQQIFSVYFQEFGLLIKETDKSKLFDRIVSLVDGYQNLEQFNDERIFDLFVNLSPKRVERIASDLVTMLQEKLNLSVPIDKGLVEDALESAIGSLSTITRYNKINAVDIFSRLKVPRSSSLKSDYGSIFEQLVNRKIFLRGKAFKCPLCNSNLWLPFSELKDDVKCYCCNTQINIPVFVDQKPLSDSFRLNELVINAVDQGILPELAVAYSLYNQYIPPNYLFNFDVFDTETKERITDIDVIIMDGSRLGIGEIKADRGFSDKQVDTLLEIAERISADFVLFSTLKEKDSAEISELVTLLKGRNLEIPAFILTKENLFGGERVSLSKYYSAEEGNERPRGPIIIK